MPVNSNIPAPTSTAVVMTFFRIDVLLSSAAPICGGASRQPIVKKSHNHGGAGWRRNVGFHRRARIICGIAHEPDRRRQARIRRLRARCPKRRVAQERRPGEAPGSAIQGTGFPGFACRTSRHPSRDLPACLGRRNLRRLRAGAELLHPANPRRPRRGRRQAQVHRYVSAPWLPVPASCGGAAVQRSAIGGQSHAGCVTAGESEQGPGTGVFRRRSHRRYHHRARLPVSTAARRHRTHFGDAVQAH